MRDTMAAWGLTWLVSSPHSMQQLMSTNLTYSDEVQC